MDVRNSEVYHTTLQNQDHCLKIELKGVFHSRLQAQTMRVQFIIKPKRKMSSKHISYYFLVVWLANINRDQKLRDFLSSETILQKFNVPKKPWWGGQFERLIGLIKASLYRPIRKTQLTWAELEEVLLDIEIILNNRLLTYIEEEID